MKAIHCIINRDIWIGIWLVRNTAMSVGTDSNSPRFEFLLSYLTSYTALGKLLSFSELVSLFVK